MIKRLFCFKKIINGSNKTRPIQAWNRYKCLEIGFYLSYIWVARLARSHQLQDIFTCDYIYIFFAMQ